MKLLLSRVEERVREHFGQEEGRITRARAVAEVAGQLLAYIDADECRTLCAALLFEIGHHGSGSGACSNAEGAVIARRILGDLGCEPAFVDQVCELVGSRTAQQGVDSPEFRILLDASAFVTLAAAATEKDPEELSTYIHRSFVTEAGYRLAMKRFLAAGCLAPHLQTG